MDALLQAQQPPHLQRALQLYPQLQQWNHRLSQQSLLEQANLPQQQVEQMQRAQTELDSLCDEHDVTPTDLQIILQLATWDASAGAKAVRSLLGSMPADIEARVQRACDIVAKALKKDGSVLDVGCGYGVLCPFLMQAGISESQIYGVDLSCLLYTSPSPRD